MRYTKLAENELYHVFNRGVDKRSIFETMKDMERFFDAMDKLNDVETFGHLKRQEFPKKANRRNPVSRDGVRNPLVKFIAYNLSVNHFHFILEQVTDRGIERFMHKLCVSHSKYFNLKYNRTGTLFQGRFKAIHIDSNEYLLHLSAYVNLNDLAHSRGRKPLLSKSSWEEYISKSNGGLCDKSIILDQFNNKGGYKKFAEQSLKDIIRRKDSLKDLDEALSKPGFETGFRHFDMM